VATVNARQTTWTAEVSSKFQGMSTEEAKRLMGTVVDPLWAVHSPKKAPTSEFLSAELPATFDSRENWPACQAVIGHVRDQSNCGSCWAHGTTEAFNDRLCIATKGDFTTLLSTADTTGCCNFIRCFSMGCNGGQIGSPWNFFVKHGVVSGGDYGANDTCYPYTMPFCSHHIEGSPYADCGSVKQKAPKCS
jgi:cathepsin B